MIEKETEEEEAEEEEEEAEEEEEEAEEEEEEENETEDDQLEVNRIKHSWILLYTLMNVWSDRFFFWSNSSNSSSDGQAGCFSVNKSKYKIVGVLPI